jgi:DNA repair protein RecO (recombination protein O)
MRQKTTKAVVLKRINYGEADRILTVLTQDSGRLTLFAKGARRAKSKLSGGLELFSVTDITYIDGINDMKTVTSTRLANHFESIVKNVDRTMSAYDFMSLVYTFSEHTENSDYYELLIGGLKGLNDHDLRLSIVECWFYMNILDIFGSNINTESPLGNGAFSESATYDFSYDDMSFFEHPGGVVTPKHIKLLRLVIRSSEPGRLKTIVGVSALADELVQTLKTAASMHKA